MKPHPSPQSPQSPDDFKALTGLLSGYSKLANNLAQIEARFQSAITDLIGQVYRDEFQSLQEQISAHEAAIETLVIRHPEWFGKSKTIKTPFGTVASRSTTRLEVPNEEATIALLELRGEESKPFLRERKFLSIESLEALDDAELRRLKVSRVTTEKILVTPAKIDLGKAVAKAAKEPAAQS